MRLNLASSGRESRRLRSTACRLALAAALLPCAAAADDEPGTVETPVAAGRMEATNDPAELAPIVVDAERSAQPALVERSMETPEDATGFGETIFADPLWRGFESTADLLGQSVGAQVRRRGGRDDFATLSIRGAPAAQLRILLDGVSLGRASDSVVNLADLPMDTIERIEVYRGFSPVSLTPVSAAGVVNVVTRDPETATGSFAAGGGSFGSAKTNAGAAGPLLGGSVAAFASYRHTEGDFDFVQPNAVNNPNDDTVEKLRNNDSDTVENLLRWRRPLGDDVRLQARHHLFYKDEGVPGFQNYSREARLETIREIAAAGLGDPDGRWNAEQVVTWERKDFSDSPFRQAVDNVSETIASTTAVRWARPVAKSHWVSASSEFTWEGFDQTSGGLPTRNAGRSSLAAGIGDDWTIEKIDTTLTLQVRHQQLWNASDSPNVPDDDEGSTDPRVGLRWQPLARLPVGSALSALSSIVAKANFSTYFRPPNFDELYGTDGFTLGNPALVPETGRTWDAGFEWNAAHERLGQGSLGYSYFGSDIDDMIIVTLDFDRIARAENVSGAKVRGHEARAEWRGPYGFALSMNYTRQEAISRSERPTEYGKDLPGIAPDEGWGRLSWTGGRFTLAYDLEVTGAHYVDRENVEGRKLPTRTVHGVSIVYGPFWKGLRLTFEGDNLGDSLVPDEIGYPLPGRAFYATLSWSAAPGEGGEDEG